MTIDVDGNVILVSCGLSEIPFKFGRVNGMFNVSNNSLTSLKNSPTIVADKFICYGNKLISLLGGPSESGWYNCSYNSLKSLSGSPVRVNGNFLCNNNFLFDLKGGPKKVMGNYNCSNNKIQSLSEIGEVEGLIDCGYNRLINMDGHNGKFTGSERTIIDNPIFFLIKFFGTPRKFYEYNQSYSFLRGDSIIKSRIESAYEEIIEENNEIHPKPIKFLPPTYDEFIQRIEKSKYWKLI